MHTQKHTWPRNKCDAWAWGSNPYTNAEFEKRTQMSSPVISSGWTEQTVTAKYDFLKKLHEPGKSQGLWDTEGIWAEFTLFLGWSKRKCLPANFQVSKDKLPWEVSRRQPAVWHCWILMCSSSYQRRQGRARSRVHSCSKPHPHLKGQDGIQLWIIPGWFPFVGLSRQKVNRKRISIYTALVTKHGFCLER